MRLTVAFVFGAHLALPFATQDKSEPELIAVAESYEAARFGGQSIARWLSDDYVRISQGGAIQGKPLERNGRGYEDIGLRDMRDRIVRVYGAGFGVVAGETGMEGAPGPVRRLLIWRKEPAGWKVLSEHTTFIEPAGWHRSKGPIPEPKPLGLLPPDQQWFIDKETQLSEAGSAAVLLASIADDAIIVDDRGRVQSAATWSARLLAPDAPRVRLAIASVLIMGDAARTVGQLRDVATAARATQFTHLWIRRNDTWQIAVSQASPIEGW